MIRQFIEEVPLDKNRRLIRNYVDTFTGLVAADTLEQVVASVFPERTCDRFAVLINFNHFNQFFRSNAVRVLQKFIDEHLIEDVQEPAMKRFRDDTTLYRYFYSFKVYT
jgi:hypothetical protein